MFQRAIVLPVAALLALGAGACGGAAGDPGIAGGEDAGGSGLSSGGGVVTEGGAPSSGPEAAAPRGASDGGDGAVQVESGGPAPADSGAAGDGASSRAVPVPKPAGACPTFQNGMVTFNPAAGPRSVQLFLDPATLSKHGPLVLYWYSTYASPAQTTQALGTALQTIESLGGIVAAPVDNGTGMFPWLDNVPGHMLLADEIVGCAVAEGIDPTRIHALGFSAGALMTTDFAFGRSSYLASVATYSGGLTSGSTAPAYQDASNKFAALILTGGATDNVFNTDFRAASMAFQARLKADGHSALYCDHGGGHSIPAGYTAAVGQFLLDHPFGTNPSPYVGALPPALSSCTF